MCLWVGLRLAKGITSQRPAHLVEAALAVVAAAFPAVAFGSPLNAASRTFAVFYPARLVFSLCVFA